MKICCIENQVIIAETGTGNGICLEVHEKSLFLVMHEKELKVGITVTGGPSIYLPNVGGARVEER
ncbi:hypothetical protein GCM10009001_24290 [Virgibacillus siamensis]|uniref:Uncharacterized protein n=1 Tax=Virgibacillus siamensis TaxID=480071 RepID=A0ABP3RC47_9BACI